MVGTGYLDAALSLAVISTASIANGLALPLLVLFQAVGEAGKAFKAVCVGVIAEVASSTLLVPLLGVIGGVAGRCILFTATLAWAIYEAKALHPKPRFNCEMVWKGLTAALIMATVILALEVAYPSPWMMPLYIMVGSSSYVLGLKILRGLTREDLWIIEAVAPRWLKRIVILAERLV
jgi:O-antigen/teichoic acid export membrane protein